MEALALRVASPKSSFSFLPTYSPVSFSQENKCNKKKYNICFIPYKYNMK